MKDPTISAIQEYVAQDIDTGSDTKYYGFATLDGRWYIMKEVTSAGSYRFSSGAQGGYAAAWTGRAALTYNYIYAVTIL